MVCYLLSIIYGELIMRRICLVLVILFLAELPAFATGNSLIFDPIGFQPPIGQVSSQRILTLLNRQKRNITDRVVQNSTALRTLGVRVVSNVLPIFHEIGRNFSNKIDQVDNVFDEDINQESLIAGVLFDTLCGRIFGKTVNQAIEEFSEIAVNYAVRASDSTTKRVPSPSNISSTPIASPNADSAI